MISYKTMSEAMRAIFSRAPKQIIGIVSLNGEAYFVKRSNPAREQATVIAASTKISLGEELKKKFNLENTNPKSYRELVKELENYFVMDGIPTYFPPDPYHAEEKIMLAFDNMIAEFNKNGSKKIHTIDIFLSHSPCIEHSYLDQRNASSSKQIANLDMPKGCFEKLNLFFKNKYKANNLRFFVETPKIRVHYDLAFEPDKNYQKSKLVRPADPVLKQALSPAFK